MHYIGIIGFISFGCMFIGLGLAHEFTWFVRRKGSMTKGRIVELVDDRSDGIPTYSAKVEYESEGAKHLFTSKYGTSSPPEVGSYVDVVVPAKPRGPEIYTLGNRFLFTAIPIALGLIFIFVGLGVQPIK